MLNLTNEQFINMHLHSIQKNEKLMILQQTRVQIQKVLPVVGVEKTNPLLT